MPLSLRCGGAGAESYLERTTNLPPITACSILFWWKFTSGAAGVQCVWHYGAAAWADYEFGYNVGAGNWRSYNGLSAVVVTTAPTTGRWHHIAVTIAGTSGNNFLLYQDGVLNATNASRAIVGTTFTLGSVGSLNPGFGANQSFAAIKAYDRALSLAEIRREIPYALPVSAIGINAYYPMPSVLDTMRAREYGPPDWRDWSGKRREWIKSGIVTLEAGPRQLG